MLDDFAEGYADTQNVLRPFYTLTDSQGNGLFSQAELRELERNISLNVGEMSGIGLILSIQRQRQAANAGTTMGAFLNVKQKSGRLSDNSARQQEADCSDGCSIRTS